MRPTVDWLKRAFVVYNRQYFGGKLPMPKFEVSDKCTFSNNGVEDDAFGYYMPNARYNLSTRRVTRILDSGTICLTTKWSRDVNDVIGTLLHEMAHMYVYLVMRVYPYDIHGKEFMSVASRLAEDGWDVVSNDLKDSDKIDADDEENTNNTRILCLISKPKGKNYKYWCCICDKNTSNQVYLLANKIPGVTSVKFYQCNSKNLEFYKMNPMKLNGFGGMTLQDITKAMSNYFGEDPSLFDFNKAKKL